jgi:tetratricopeptide (TPR) repeat protein
VLWAGAGAVAVVLFLLTVRQVETWRDSTTLWSQVVRLHPRSDAAWTSRGSARGEAGDIQGALADFRTAVALGSRRGDLYDGLGNVYGALGGPDSALIMFDRALELDPSLARTYYNRAIAKLRVGRAREAIPDLDRAGQMSLPLAATLHFPRANAYMQIGMYREAAAEFSLAIDAGQLLTDAHCNRGLCRLALGDRAGAAADFREALRIDPDFVPAREQLRAL